MGPDFRVLARRGRKDAQKYFLQYKDPMPVSQLVREVAACMQVRLVLIHKLLVILCRHL